MARQMKAERNKWAAILEAEGLAPGRDPRGQERAGSGLSRGRGREHLTEAEAKATTVVSAAIAKGDVNAINYFIAQKYTEALQQRVSRCLPAVRSSVARSR